MPRDGYTARDAAATRCQDAIARGGVQDYWIVNLVDRVLEVYRDPVPDSTAVYGAHYRSVVRFTPPEIVALLALPTVRIAVADLLP